MALQAGRVLRGRLYNFRLEKPLTKCSTLFKASVLRQSEACGPEWAVIKTAFTQHQLAALQQEYRNHCLPHIHDSKYIRALVDTIGDFDSIGKIKVSPFEDPLVETSGDPWCLALEWMDYTLADFDPKYFQEHPKLLQTASWSVLKALSILKEHKLVHSDVKQENILVSNIDSPEPTVKLADLGTTTQDGYSRHRLQSVACRAPEVWQAKGCFHVSDVWSLGVTLTDCLFPTPIFGTRDNTNEDSEVWCVAKLMRLFNGLSPPVDKLLESEFKLAAKFADPNTGCMTVGSLSEELKRLNISPVAYNFIMSLLVVDEKKRSTADKALNDRFFQVSCD